MWPHITNILVHGITCINRRNLWLWERLKDQPSNGWTIWWSKCVYTTGKRKEHRWLSGSTFVAVAVHVPNDKAGQNIQWVFITVVYHRSGTFICTCTTTGTGTTYRWYMFTTYYRYRTYMQIKKFFLEPALKVPLVSLHPPASPYLIFLIFLA